RAWFSGRGIQLEADSAIVYDDGTGRVRTRGSTLLTPDRGDPVRSRSMVYDIGSSSATALGAETTYSEGGANWIVRGDLDRVEDGLLFGSRTRFTSCDLDPPHSYFEAENLKIIRDRVLVARSVRLYFEDVPVAWLPFMAQPIQSGRASGLLTPSFSATDVVRTSQGYDRRVSNIGYYWAMSDYSDATLAMDWWSNNYTALTGSLRYNWARQFLSGDASVRRFWRETGAREFAVSTRNSWEVTERTRVRAAGNFVSNTGLVRQNSLDPAELTSAIESNASLQHRFDWGTLALSANRQQYLSDDRVTMSLPNASLNFNTVTLFSAAPQEARWYNNLNLGGSGSFRRDVREFVPQPDSAFTFGQADNVRTRAQFRSTASLGDVSLRGSVNYQETAFPSVPAALLGSGQGAGSLALAPDGMPALFDEHGSPVGERVSFADATADWDVSLSYQQRLIGSSTVTPSVSLRGTFARVDSIPEAMSFQEGPTRVNFGLSARTELFGFYPGFRSWDALRHKVTPSLSYSWAPTTRPTELQERVFGVDELRRRSQLNLTINQTLEARVSEDRVEEEAAEEAGGVEDGTGDEEAPTLPGEDGAETTDATDEDTGDDPEDSDEGAEAGGAEVPGLSDEGLRRQPPSRVVTLLSLSTSALAYDLVRADSLGRFSDGFTTTSLRNTVRSDYFRALDLSFSHNLWEDPGESADGRRSFSPHLEQLSLGFRLNDDSRVVNALAGLLGVDRSEEEDHDHGLTGVQADEDSFAEGAGRGDGFDQNRVLPGGAREGTDGPAARRQGWDARIQYSLRRPRSPASAPTSGSLRRQTVRGSLNFQPTLNWEASWSTSYDLEEQRFNDHALQLVRDLHEWEARFGFRQAANGNWSFQFEVSLRANEDLRFDYQQRNTDSTRGLNGGRDLGF
ncbi:MAG: LPS-assembly protein LptD, partial [Gemmatimonadales bacterium]